VQPLPVIGVDVGGTKILASVVTQDGTLGEQLERRTDVSSQDALLAGLDALVAELRVGNDVAAIGFGLPSRIDQRSGRAIASVNIPLDGLDFRDRMRERHGLPVGIDNDGNAAAIGEWHAGAAQGALHVVMLTLGTGVGGGLILDGRPYRGATGSGAELGHVVLEPGGPPCGCGGHGHLESFASGRAAERMARELYGPAAGAQELVDRARRGEEAAIGALADIGGWLGAGMTSFVNAFEPEVIVVGGGFGGATGELLLAPAREVVAREGLTPGRDTVRIVEAQLGADAGVIGAAMIAVEALGAEG